MFFVFCLLQQIIFHIYCCGRCFGDYKVIQINKEDSRTLGQFTKNFKYNRNVSALDLFKAKCLCKNTILNRSSCVTQVHVTCVTSGSHTSDREERCRHWMHYFLIPITGQIIYLFILFFFVLFIFILFCLIVLAYHYSEILISFFFLMRCISDCDHWPLIGIRK